MTSENQPRIVFAGTPEFAACALRQLIEHDHRIVAVYTQPDRPAGRGRKPQTSEVKQLAQQYQLPIEQPQSLKKDPDAIDRLRTYQPDILIVAAYGLLLPQSVLDIPTLGCLNIHASLLPRWRGAAPIQRAILAGDSQTGITIMQMDAGLDTGDMLLKKTIPIENTITAGELHDQLARLGGEAILEALANLPELQSHRHQQDASEATYASKLDKREAWIDWTKPATMIERQVRAFNPWPVAQTLIDNKVLRIRQAKTSSAPRNASPGTILAVSSDCIDVACGEGQLCLLDGQLPGGKAIRARDLLNGHASLFAVGKQFSLPPSDG